MLSCFPLKALKAFWGHQQSNFHSPAIRQTDFFFSNFFSIKEWSNMVWVLPLTSLQLRLKRVTTCKASLKSPAQNMLWETCFQLQSPSPLPASQNSPFPTWAASYPDEWTFSMKPVQCQGQGEGVNPAPCPSTNLPGTGLLMPAEPQPVMGSPLPAPGSVPGLCILHSWLMP